LLDGKKQNSMKPYLLNQIDNNLGGVTQIQYCSSTKFYLEDKKNGRPWITKLPFPVQLVEKIITIDKITGSRYTYRFKYHDGYYDQTEKEFRGFGYVETWDTETYEEFQKNIQHVGEKDQEINKKNYVPPVYTRTWHHTGAFFQNNNISNHYKQQYFKGDNKAYPFPDSVFEASIYKEDPETLRQAYAALRGHVIRTEVYAMDKDEHPEKYKNPYTVKESNMMVKLFQERALVSSALETSDKNTYAVFLVNPLESIFYHYERNPKDPRIEQEFNLEIDDFGNVLQSCNIFLPRRPDTETGATAYPEQQTLKAILKLYKYVAPLAGYQFCDTCCEEQSLELSGLDLQNKMYFSLEELKKQIKPLDLPERDNIILYGHEFTGRDVEARQITWIRYYFWNEKQTEVLPLSEISSRALPHHTEEAVFTKDFTLNIFDGRLIDEESYDNDGYLSNILYKHGGYFYDPHTTYWWNRGLVQHYFQPAHPECFFMPSKTENSFAMSTLDNENKQQEKSLCLKTSVEYDAYYLSPIKTIQNIDDKRQNIITAKPDYITLQPAQITDINNNTTQVLFDPLGQVIVTSVLGAENGVKAGGIPLYPDGQSEDVYKKPADSFFDRIIKKPKDYLQGACTYFYYNLNAWQEKQQPVSSINLVRNHYYYSPDRDDSPYCQISVSYYDGLGRDLETKLLAGEHWQVSGRTVYNNKGKPFEQYLSFFSTTPDYEDQKDISSLPPTVTHYDPVLREFRIDTPKGFFSKVEFTPWEEHHFDEDDTILDSSYYKMNYPHKLSPDQKDSIDKAVKFYNTPLTKITDNMGVVTREIQNNLGNVSKDAFKDIVNGTALTSEEIWSDLKSKGYIVEDENKQGLFWLTQKFQRYAIEFKLDLDDKFKDFLKQITDLLNQNCLISYYQTDISGRIIKSIDPRLYESKIKKNKDYYNFKYQYAMDGEDPVLVHSADAGTEKHLSNIFDNQLWSWSPRDYCQLITYDKLQRQAEIKVKLIITSGKVSSYHDFNLVEKSMYGDELITQGKTKEELQSQNLWGALYQQNDLSGIVKNTKYSMMDKVLETSRQMPVKYEKAINWYSNPKPLLENEIFISRFTYNAILDLVSETAPDCSVITNIYNQAGQLEKVWVDFNDKTKQKIIEHIDYDANGQRTRIRYGNKVETRYKYEDTTLNLISIKSTRPANGNNNTVIQDIQYYYDPSDNMTRSYDNAYDVVFNSNQIVKPLSEYTYDALYRLIQAKGRQHPGIKVDSGQIKKVENKNSVQYQMNQIPHLNDQTQLKSYTEEYTYDDSGNLVETRHLKTNAWTRRSEIMPDSNRLKKLIQKNDKEISKNINYDDSGNMNQLNINSTTSLTFNCCENLVRATIIERTDDTNDCDFYVYDSDEIRTRKVCQRKTDDGIEIEEKIYLGNYEIKRKKKKGQESLTFERQTLRIMDDKTCVAMIHYIKTDKQNPKKEKTRQCRFQMDNHIGSVSLEMNKDARLISYEEFFPYGGTSLITGKNIAEVKLKEYRYSGKERDNSTGLYYYGARYYAPWLGRWLKPDPAGTVDGMNLYAFVGGNPVMFVDHSGMSRAKARRQRERRRRARQKKRDDQHQEVIAAIRAAPRPAAPVAQATVVIADPILAAEAQYGVTTPTPATLPSEVKALFDRQKVKGTRQDDGRTSGITLTTLGKGNHNWHQDPSTKLGAKHAREVAEVSFPTVVTHIKPEHSTWGHQIAARWGGRGIGENAASATNGPIYNQERYQTIIEDAISRVCGVRRNSTTNRNLSHIKIKHTAYLYRGTKVARYMRIKVYKDNVKVIDQITREDAPKLDRAHSQALKDRFVTSIRSGTAVPHCKKTTPDVTVLSHNYMG
jgi:RHS repeat-associated protein